MTIGELYSRKLVIPQKKEYTLSVGVAKRLEKQ